MDVGSLSRIVGLLGLLSLPASAASPDEVAGLVAWFDVSAMHEKMRGGETVDVWPDSSVGGHDLVDDRTGLPAVFEIQQVGGLPAVRLRKANSHSVTTPFALEDHTIFLVHAAECRNCALLQSTEAGENGFGIVLHGSQGRHQLKRGRNTVPYSAPVRGREGYAVTVLARESGVLRGFVNGIDISTAREEQGTIHVGRMFGISATNAVKFDADGLSLSEMIFYDRFLEPAERDAVSSYLADKYSIELEGSSVSSRAEPPAQEARWVQLGPKGPQNVNLPELTAVAWRVADKLTGPFRHDAEKEPTTLYCTEDETQVRLWVSLMLSTSVDGTDIGFGLLKNREEYLSEPVETGPLAVRGEARKVEIELDATAVLSAGDYVELVAFALGAAGEVTLVPQQVELVVAGE